MTFNSEDWCRRVKLAQTDEEMKALAEELASKPMDLILKDDQESSSMVQRLSLAPMILNTLKGKIEVD